MAVNTTSVMSNNVQDAYTKDILFDFQAKRVFSQFWKTVTWNGDPYNTDTVKFMIYDNMNPNSTALSETTDPTSKSISNDFATVTMAEQGDLSSLTKKLELSSYTSILRDIGKVVSQAMTLSTDLIARKAYDTQVWANYISFGGTATSVATVASSDVLTMTKLEDVFAILRGRNIPGYQNNENAKGEMEHYICLVHPHTARDLKYQTSNGWRTPREYADPKDLYTGELGMFDGVRFVQSSLCKIQYNAGVKNSTTCTATEPVGETSIALASATGHYTGNTVNITTADGKTYTYRVTSASGSSPITIGVCIAIDNEPYYTKTAGIVYPTANGDVVTTGIDVYTTYVFGDQAIGYAEKEAMHPTVTYPQGGLQRQTDFGYYGYFGFGEIKADCLHKVFSSSRVAYHKAS